MEEGKERDIKKGIPLCKELYLEQGGLFPAVHAGKITHIASVFQGEHQQMSQQEILRLINQRD
jgi:hypothetical protein